MRRALLVLLLASGCRSGSPSSAVDGDLVPVDGMRDATTAGDGPISPTADATPTVADGPADTPVATADAGSSRDGCAPAGGYCDSNAGCCGGVCEGQVCRPSGCAADGTPCASAASRCCGSCHQGKCVPFCSPENFKCNGHDQCCNGVCTRGQCRPPGPTDCMDAGTGTCVSNAQCCSGECRAGICFAPVLCRPPGVACQYHLDCCDGNCVGGACVVSRPVEPGDRCASDLECTSRRCLGGVCASPCTLPGEGCQGGGQWCCGGAGTCPFSLAARCQPAKTCFQLYARCQVGTDCCSGLCERGLCRKAGPCAPSGTECAGAAECCSGLCATGDAGPERCATCLALGWRCRTTKDCCDGMCLQGLCKPTARNCAANGSGCNPGEDFCCSGRCAGVPLTARCLPP